MYIENNINYIIEHFKEYKADTLNVDDSNNGLMSIDDKKKLDSLIKIENFGGSLYLNSNTNTLNDKHGGIFGINDNYKFTDANLGEPCTNAHGVLHKGKAISKSVDTIVIVGSSGTVLVSKNDGLSWFVPKITTSGELLLAVNNNGNGTWMITSVTKIYVSYDNALTWNVSITPNDKVYSIANIKYTWVFGLCNNGNNKVSYDNGKTWNVSTTAPTSHVYDVISDGKNQWLSGGCGTVSKSTNALNWIQTTSGSHPYSMNTDGNGTWVAVGESGYVWVSIDNSVTWTSFSVGGVYLRKVYYDGKGTWVAVGDSGTFKISYNNAKKWDNVSSGTTNRLYDVSNFGNSWVAVGENGTIIVSYDNALTWSIKSLPSVTVHLYNVDCINGRFVIIGASGTILLASKELDFFSPINIISF